VRACINRIGNIELHCHRSNPCNCSARALS
jgi:hypothetical protein